MTAREVRARIFRHLLTLTGTMALLATLAVALLVIRPEPVMWVASSLLIPFVPGIAFDAFWCVHYLTFRVGDRTWDVSRACAAYPRSTLFQSSRRVE